jgi:hypothetical protein
MTTSITDSELRVFQMMMAAAKDGHLALMRVVVNGEERAAIASYEKTEKGAHLGVYGLLPNATDIEVIGKQLSGQQLIDPPVSRDTPELIPVPMPAADELRNYISLHAADYDLYDMLREHGAKMDASADQEQGTDFVVFANKDDGQTYLAASMIQLFRKTDDEIYRSGECPFCATELVDQGEWRECPTCRCAWAEGGKFRRT